ncbi:MAG: type II toxin-antitoxin system VapC family toxin [Phycisphaerales bacterium]|nr:type II toxin-antitoxin system VapC family toxin [Phycisphaerales bacterium]
MADEKPSAVGIDSCVLIELFDVKSPKRTAIRDIFTDAENHKLTFLVSTMVHAEVAASSKKLKPWDIAEVRRALSQSYFEPVELSIPIALLASDIARETGIKPPDAVHAATCVAKRVRHLLTIDDKLLKVNEKIIFDATDRSKTLQIITPGDFCDQFYHPLFKHR